MLVVATLHELHAQIDDSMDVGSIGENALEPEKKEEEKEENRLLNVRRDNLAALLKEITAKITDSHKLWNICAKFQLGIGLREQVGDFF